MTFSRSAFIATNLVSVEESEKADAEEGPTIVVLVEVAGSRLALGDAADPDEGEDADTDRPVDDMWVRGEVSDEHTCEDEGAEDYEDALGGFGDHGRNGLRLVRLPEFVDLDEGDAG